MTPNAVADRTAPAATPAEQLEARVVEAMIDCIGRWGVAKTTADDIARAAGISRATLYRVFPGGMDVAFDALVRHETARFFDTVSARLAHADSLEETIVIGFVEAARFLLDHGPLQYLLAHEPEQVLPSAASHRLQGAFAIATAFTAPYLRPFVADDGVAVERADWVVRQFFSYALVPAPSLVLTDEAAVRRFARTYLLPVFTTDPDQEH